MIYFFFLISAAWHYTGGGLGNTGFHRHIGMQVMLVSGLDSMFAT